MFPKYSLYPLCKTTVSATCTKYNIVHLRNVGKGSFGGFNAAKQALKDRVSTAKKRTLQKADIVRQESSHAWKPEAFRDYSKMATYDFAKYAIGAGVVGSAYLVKKQYDKYHKKHEIVEKLSQRIPLK